MLGEETASVFSPGSEFTEFPARKARPAIYTSVHFELIQRKWVNTMAKKNKSRTYTHAEATALFVSRKLVLYICFSSAIIHLRRHYFSRARNHGITLRL